MISLVPSESWGFLKGDWSPFEAAPPEAGKSVSAETLAALSGCGLLPENGVWGHAPPGAFGRAAASPQTRQMRCWPSSERTTNPSSRRKRQDSLSLSLVLFPPKPLCWPSSERTTNPSSRRKRQDSLSLSLDLFPPKPLRWVSAGALLGAVIKTPVLYFLHFCVGGYHLPSGCCGCVGTTPRGVYFSRKNGFLRVGALRRRTSCSLLHTALFRRSCMGVVSLPSACASCC